MARKSLTLSDLLPAEGIAEVERLHRANRLTVQNVRPILAKYEKISGEKGVLVDYLAYYLEYVGSCNPVVS